MGAALITWYRRSVPDGNITVPCPDSDPPALYLWDRLLTEIPALREVGFTALQLPPASKAQGGRGDGCDGYGVFDRADLGDKNQQGSVATRYGTLESLRRLVAVAHANDMQVYHDVVLHQVIGANGGPSTYRYLGADGKTLNGRWPLSPGFFRGDVVVEQDGAYVPATIVKAGDTVPAADLITIAEDAVPSVAWDFSFGDELSYQNCRPGGHSIAFSISYVQYLFETTGADGARLDDVKGMWAPFVGQLAHSPALKGKFLYGEYFDNADACLWWAYLQEIGGRVGVEDFQGKFNMQSAANGNNAWALSNSCVATMNPPLAVTFVENPDTDGSSGEQTIQSKLLVLAEQLTNPGYSFVFGKDYFMPADWPGAYGLKPWIDTMVGVQANLMRGDPRVLYLDDSVKVKISDGYPGLLTALNFDSWNSRTVTVQTSFGPNVQLHDYAGHVADIWTDDQGRATINLPSNAYNAGRSYCFFSRTGYWAAPEIKPRPVTQCFIGAEDLALGSLVDGSNTLGRICVAAGAEVSFRIDLSTLGWVLGKTVARASVIDPEGNEIAFANIDNTVMREGYGTASVSGWHDIVITVDGLTGSSEVILAVTYTAPKNVTPEALS